MRPATGACTNSALVFAPFLRLTRSLAALATRDVLTPRDSARSPKRQSGENRILFLRKQTQLTNFHEFGLATPITRALAEEKYETPTPIQAGTIPLVLSGRDIVGIAQTGTGKTAAFALPILHRLATLNMRADKKACRILVLSPTRELSNQILDSFRTYGRHLRVSSAIAIGGVPIGKQIRSLANGVDVLVATPGRLLDLVENRAVILGQVEVLVLDEADRMLDMGFIRDIRKIVALLPKKRQTLFFSATMPAEITSLADQMLTDPARVSVTPPTATADRIEQRVIHVDRASKPGLLVDLLKAEPDGRTIVFTRTKHGADRVVQSLNRAGLDAGAIHGNKSQNQREHVLARFRDGKLATLVATDIAARGIDVDGITHVVNFDLPNIPESYVHRIGRTARAGAEGVAISFVASDETPFLRSIEKLIRTAIPATRHASSPARAERPEGQWDPVKSGNGVRQGQPREDRHQPRSGPRRRRRPMQQAGRPHARPATANVG